MLSDQTLNEIVAEHQKAAGHHFAATGAPQVSGAAAVAQLKDILAKLRAKGIPWTSLLALIGPILNMIFAGTPIGGILAAILAILFPPTPTPPTP